METRLRDHFGALEKNAGHSDCLEARNDRLSIARQEQALLHCCFAAAVDAKPTPERTALNCQTRGHPLREKISGLCGLLFSQNNTSRGQIARSWAVHADVLPASERSWRERSAIFAQ